MSIWTPELESELRRLWNEGLSAREIGIIFGVQRGTITGKVWRLGLKGRTARVNALQTERRLKARATMPPKPKGDPKVRRRLPPSLTLVTLQQINAGALNIPLLDLTPTMCRWPTGQGGQHTFCGHAREGEHTMYCPAHHGASVNGPRMEKVRKREDQYLRYMAGADRLSKAA